MYRSRLLLVCVAAAVAVGVLAPAGMAAGATTTMSMAVRLSNQRVVEEILWRHRTWPDENPQPKPSLDAVMPASAIRAKVEDVLRMSDAVERLTGHAIAGAELQAEIDRQASRTQQPEVLAELWAALGDDPEAVAETLARPVVARRDLGAWYEGQPSSGSTAFDAWWRSARDQFRLDERATRFDHRLPVIAPAAPSARASAMASGSWAPTHALPEGNIATSVVWTGSEMIVWGGTEAGQSKFDSGSRYDPATDTWQTTSGVGAPDPRKQHSAVWTGTEMIVWGGCGPLPEHSCQVNTGGRYDPATDTWKPVATAGAPQARIDHTAVWTGTEMIVWGGCRFSNDACSATALGNSGGRYDPVSNSWQATSTAGAPAGRTGHTAVWTGSEMIVWGGAGASVYADGGRYDPATNAWTPTAPVPSNAARYDHTAVWTGTQMIMWGGTNGTAYFNNGARYSPAQNKWRLVSTAGAPAGRAAHTAVWTGSVMIVWGGCTSGQVCSTQLNTGGRYDPAANAWTATSTAGAPSARSNHVAVWTGQVMVVWGGASLGDPFTGGRYDPVTDSWLATNDNRAASAREWHTAVWTGTEMIVWGGDDRFNGTVNTGGRYTPATDSWQPTSTAGAPTGRFLHTAVWTGTQMVVWGGQYGSTIFKNGGRYDPTTDSWTPTSTVGAPTARSEHTAVWTGTQMIVWGGTGNTSFMNTGGRYDPASNSWTATATAGAPAGRDLHSAVWTGSQMIVWGGQISTGYTSAGGRYDPASNSWTPTSTTGAPTGRYSNAAVWTGTKMVVWGGATYDVNGWTLYRTGGIYDPATNSWTATSTTNAPTGRLFFASVWTGSALVVWGGCTDSSTCATATYTGGEFDPATNTWVATSLTGAPGARGHVTGVWTGSEMIVWGGSAEPSGTFTNTGGRYTPMTA